MVRVRSRIRIVGVNPYVHVDAGAATRLRKNWRGPMPVRYEAEGGPAKAWRINLMPLGDGTYRLHLNGQVRRELNLGVGDKVCLRIQFDSEYRGGPGRLMRSWFRRELAKDPLAKSGWLRLPPSRQKEVLRYLARLKTAEAKARNLRRAMDVLAGGRARFMGRSWNEGDGIQHRRRT